MKRAMLPLFLWVLPALFVSALNVNDLFDSELAQSLYAGEKPVLAQFTSPRPQLIPRHEFLRKLIEEYKRDLGPSVMVETLNLYRKPLGPGFLSADEKTSLYNSVLALSTLAGLQYYSASRGVMRTFYETSSVIDGPLTKKTLPDPVYQRPPSKLTLYARQKDLSFGDNIYQYDFFDEPGALIFTQQNLTSLNYGIIPAVGKNKLCSIAAILDTEEQIIVYLATMAKAASLPGMKERIGNSFTNRADAVFSWFNVQAGQALGKP
jgi:hypothetical protein